MQVSRGNPPTKKHYGWSYRIKYAMFEMFLAVRCTANPTDAKHQYVGKRRVRWEIAALSKSGRQGHAVNRRRSPCVGCTATKLLNGLAVGKNKDIPLQMPYRPPTHHPPQICKVIGIDLVGSDSSRLFGPFRQTELNVCVLDHVQNRAHQSTSTKDLWRGV